MPPDAPPEPSKIIEKPKVFKCFLKFHLFSKKSSQNGSEELSCPSKFSQVGDLGCQVSQDSPLLPPSWGPCSLKLGSWASSWANLAAFWLHFGWKQTLLNWIHYRTLKKLKKAWVLQYRFEKIWKKQWFYSIGPKKCWKTHGFTVSVRKINKKQLFYSIGPKQCWKTIGFIDPATEIVEKPLVW